MSAAVYANAAIEIARFIESTRALYEAGVIDEAELSQLWETVGVNVKRADALWQSAGPSVGP
tara:strand:+ start:68 stop:253 length:186 start_codon:yes stop_codon:yes gene_type:complete